MRSRACQALPVFQDPQQGCLARSGGQRPNAGGLSPETWRGAAAGGTGPDSGGAASPAACAAAARLLALLVVPAKAKTTCRTTFVMVYLICYEGLHSLCCFEFDYTEANES